MKNHKTLSLGAGCCLLLVAAGVLAQQPPLVDFTKVIKFSPSALPRLGSDSTWVQKTPKFYGSAKNKEKEWGVFEYVFDSAIPWIDEMTAKYYVLLDSATLPASEKPPEGTPRFTFCELSVRYVDIQKGKDHKISAVLLPAALLRFGKPIGFGVEVSIGDQPVFVDNQAGGVLGKVLKSKDEKWWENAQIVSGPNTVKRDGYLIDRAKTPFNLVAIDDNETSK